MLRHWTCSSLSVTVTCLYRTKTCIWSLSVFLPLYARKEMVTIKYNYESSTSQENIKSILFNTFYFVLLLLRFLLRIATANFLNSVFNYSFVCQNLPLDNSITCRRKSCLCISLETLAMKSQHSPPPAQ